MALRVKGRDPNLDWLRAGAILAVIAAHLPVLSPVRHATFSHLTWAGQFGVDLFFVLSGWLISGIYYRERSGQTHPSWFHFVKRRALRTMPPYYVALGLSFLAAHCGRTDHPPFDWPYLFFLQNYLGKMPFFAVSWSLCIEEHFYVVLPAVLARVRLSSAVTGWALLSALAISPLCRTLLYDSPTIDVFDPSVVGTHVHLDGLLAGVALRWIQVFRPQIWRPLKAICRLATLPALLALTAVYFIPPRPFYCFGYTYVSVLFAVILAGVVSSPALPGALSPVTSWIASRSYSIYLTHALALHAAQLLAVQFARTIPVLAEAIYYPVAEIAMAVAGALFYRWVEAAALRWRDRFAPAKTV